MRFPTLLIYLVATAVAALSIGSQFTTANEVCLDGSKECENNLTCILPDARLEVPSDVILFLGNTGVGKTTLVRHLTDADQELTAVEVQPGNGDFIINGSFIGVGVRSMTDVPHLFQDKDGHNLYDMPGFEDTRGPCTELKNTYYMKDILSRVTSAKVVLVVPHYSVREGQDRQEFLRMLLHTARILHNVDKFSDSIGLIISKVSHQVVKVKGVGLVPVSDEARVNSVVAFLEKRVIPHLESKTGVVLPRDAEEYDRALEILRVLLLRSGDRYPKMSLFRTPDEEGAISENELMQSGKASLRGLVHETMTYAPVDAEKDFGFSLSEKAQLYISRTAEQLDDSVAVNVLKLSNNLEQWYNEVEAEGEDVATPQKLLRVLTAIRNLTHSAQQHPAPKEFAQQFQDWDPPSKVDREVLKQTVRSCNDLYVLQTITAREIRVTPKSWVRPLETLVLELDDRFYGYIANATKRTDLEIAHGIENLSKNLELWYAGLEAESDDQATPQKLLKALNAIRNLTDSAEKHPVPMEFAQQFQDWDAPSTVDHEILKQIERSCNYLELLWTTAKRELVISPTSWVRPLEDLVRELDKRFYNFTTNAAKRTDREIAVSVQNISQALNESYAELEAEGDDIETTQNLMDGLAAIRNLTYSAKQHPAPKEFAQQFQEWDAPSTVDHEVLKQIERSCIYLDVLQTSTERELTITPTSWVRPLEDLVVVLDKRFHGYVEKTTKRIDREIGSHLRDHYHMIEQYENDIFRIPLKLQSELNAVSSMTQASEQHTTPLDTCKQVRTWNATTMEELLRHCSHLEILQNVSDFELHTSAESWLRPVNGLIRYVDDRYSWYNFLTELYNRLSKYDVQSELSKLRIPLKVDQDSVDAFLNKVAQLSLHPKRINVDQQLVSALNEILNATMTETQYFCYSGENKLTVMGDFIVLSKVRAEARCRGVKRVEVFALNTVFVDSDFTLIGDGVALAVFAPKWVITGDRKFTLDGQEGERHLYRASDGSEGTGGKDGAAGWPGKHGGFFLGVGSNFVGRKIRVSCNGGRGGQGQNGGVGSWGPSGGGNGGNGGVGGLGGLPGSGRVIALQGAPGVDLIHVEAQRGARGRGGFGGSGGIRMSRRRKRSVVLGVLYGALALTASHAIYKAMFPTLPNGKPGLNNSSNLGLIRPDEMSVSWGLTVAEYENYISHFLNDRVRSHDVFPAWNGIRTNPAIKNLSSPQ